MCKLIITKLHHDPLTNPIFFFNVTPLRGRYTLNASRILFDRKVYSVIFIFRDPPWRSRMHVFQTLQGSRKYNDASALFKTAVAKVPRAFAGASRHPMRDPGVSFRIFITRTIHHEDLIASWDLTIVHLHYSPPSTPGKQGRDIRDWLFEIENIRLSHRVKINHYFSLTLVLIIVSLKYREIIFVSRSCVKMPLLQSSASRWTDRDKSKCLRRSHAQSRAGDKSRSPTGSLQEGWCVTLPSLDSPSNAAKAGWVSSRIDRERFESPRWFEFSQRFHLLRGASCPFLPYQKPTSGVSTCRQGFTVITITTSWFS